MNLVNLIHICFVAYTILLFARIISSWFPEWRSHHLMHFVAYYTDPYLNIFRKLLPPIGGVLDLSPILAFFGLKIAEGLLLWLLR